jgi:hypothetical protein
MRQILSAIRNKESQLQSSVEEGGVSWFPAIQTIRPDDAQLLIGTPNVCANS